MRRLLRLLVLMTVALAAYPAWLALQIWGQSREDELPFRATDAIVVLGAAQYDGRPSPIFRARLDHAAHLFGENYSEKIVVTGGKRTGDRYSEATAGRNYLIAHGIPAQAIVEAGGHTTFSSLREVKRIGLDQRISSLMLVSDPLHSERVKRIAQDLGFEPTYASPASYVDLNRTRATKLRELAREVGSLLIYELLGR